MDRRTSTAESMEAFKADNAKLSVARLSVASRQMLHEAYYDRQTAYEMTLWSLGTCWSLGNGWQTSAVWAVGQYENYAQQVGTVEQIGRMS